MSIVEDDEEIVGQNIVIKRKGKDSYFTRKEIILELKHKRRSGKCFGAGKLEEFVMQPEVKSSSCYNVVNNDIWYHISRHILPEEVKTFALICSATAELVRERQFWKHLYKKYCLKNAKTEKWVLQLPERLQHDNISNCDTKCLRYYVIQSLFYCYTPLTDRLKLGYPVDALVGQTLVALWHRQYTCVWIMYYKFKRQTTHHMNEAAVSKLTSNAINSSEELVNDWESLACGKNLASSTYTHNNNMQEGFSLLVIICDRFLPFPSQLHYIGTDSSIRLCNTRQLLCKDMRGSHLELEFVIGNKFTTLVQYPNIIKHKVLPWWHPDFEKFVTHFDTSTTINDNGDEL